MVNSRLSLYKAYYRDGLGNTIAGLFSRMAPTVAPFSKQLGMKAIDVIRDKGIGAVGDLAGKAFSVAKDKIISLVRRRKLPVVLPSTTVMPVNISKLINNAVEQKLASLVASPATPSSDATSSAIMNEIAGSGSKWKRNYNNSTMILTIEITSAFIIKCLNEQSIQLLTRRPQCVRMIPFAIINTVPIMLYNPTYHPELSSKSMIPVDTFCHMKNLLKSKENLFRRTVIRTQMTQKFELVSSRTVSWRYLAVQVNSLMEKKSKQLKMRLMLQQQ